MSTSTLTPPRAGLSALRAQVDEMLAELSAEGITVPRELLRAKVATALWNRPAVLDDDGRVVEFVSNRGRQSIAQTEPRARSGCRSYTANIPIDTKKR